MNYCRLRLPQLLQCSSPSSRSSYPSPAGLEHRQGWKNVRRLPSGHPQLEHSPTHPWAVGKQGTPHSFESGFSLDCDLIPCPPPHPVTEGSEHPKADACSENPSSCTALQLSYSSRLAPFYRAPQRPLRAQWVPETLLWTLLIYLNQAVVLVKVRMSWDSSTYSVLSTRT